jgi:hypothetical protein
VSKAFEFLGFEYRWIISRRGKDVIHLRTSRKKLRRTILELRLWFRKYNSKRLKWIMGMVKAKLRGLTFAMLGAQEKDAREERINT